MTEEEIKNIDPALNIINSDNPYSKEWLFKRKDNSVFAAEVTVTTMPDGNLLALVKDITEIVIQQQSESLRILNIS